MSKRWNPHILAQDGLHGRDTIIAYRGVYARVIRRAFSLLLGEKVLIQQLTAVAADAHIMLDQHPCQFGLVDQDQT
ncbi:hypothetical protein J2Z31_001781 [Sinorhizobium kostiense]|uniref:Transposase n=1 Tax=Sinorhizobium kostiense TaxID=76747 RepID=A0ABS4QYY1_9HYPH|nr:hypothetical protein [Sinorhizobium kostiense]